MLFLVIGIILAVVSFVGIGGLNAQPERDRWNNEVEGTRGKFLCKEQIFALLLLLICIPSFVAVVPANSVGVLYSAVNGTSEETLSEGWHTKTPLEKVYKISTEIQTVEVDGLTTQTMDSQFVTSSLNIKYKVNQSNAYVVFKQFKTLKNMQEQLIVATTQRVLEKITTTYNVMDILGESRSSLYDELEIALTEELNEYGIDFKSISITDMDAGDAIETAIQQEAVAKKAVETAEQELAKTKTDAQKKVVEAQAEQDAQVIEAETLVIEATAQAEANRLLNESLSDLVIKKIFLEKWDGVVPKVMGGSDMIMDISAMME